MKAVRVIVNVVTALMLAVSFVGAGFAACTAPPITHGLAWVFVDDATSPFDRNELVRVADATRDYSFGAHDLQALYRTIYEVDLEYRDGVGYSAASTTGVGFPRVDTVTDPTSLEQLRSAFEGASELFCFSNATVSHLDDCHAIAQVAFPLVIAAVILATAGLIFTGLTGGKKRLGTVLMAAGIFVIVVFVGLAAWAIVDFSGLFTVFHGVFFSQGNWTFPYDSLLICSLPQPFWAGMAAVWLVVAALLCLIAIVVGLRLRKRAHR